jgi:hypothetical protein
MASLPASTSRKFNPADYKAAPSWFTGRFLSQLNLFTDPVYTALLNGLTFLQNFNAQTYTLTITGNSDFTKNLATFNSTISGAPSGLLLIAKNLAADPSTPFISPVEFSWYANSGLIVITGISGLSVGVAYKLTFLVF